MEEISYFSVEDFSKSIGEFAEKVEYAKLLQANLATVDENSVIELEQEIGERKWAISEYLHNSNNYQEWKSFDQNNAEMLTKYVQKGYFDAELSGTKLKQKIQDDFGKSLELHPELALTKKEKSVIKHYEENNVPEEKRTYLKEFDAVVANIHNKEKCFARNFSKMIHELPKKLPKEALKAVDLVKANPLLLKDNPHHYVVHREKNHLSVDTEQFKDILEEVSNFDSSSTNKLSKLLTSMEEMNKGNTSKNLIEKYRKLFLGSDIKPSSKKEI